LPTFRQSKFICRGRLISYGIDNLENQHHAADFVDKILKGAKPAELPIESLTTLKQLADKVIE